MHKKILKALAVGFFLMPALVCQVGSENTVTFAIGDPLPPGTICVDCDVSASGDGSSWANAKKTITEGIGVATSGSQIWVSEGTYSEAVTLKVGVVLYGGFAGTETLLSQRDIAAHPTVIDGGTARGGAPAYHVVVMDGITSATIDGFTITGGTADGDGDDNRGAGIFCRNLDETNSVSNCHITRNTGFYGAGMYVDQCSFTISDCVFISNEAQQRGGGLACNDGDVSVRNCVFNDGSAIYGGGLYAQSAKVTISRCVFVGNAAREGAGIYFDSSPSETSTITNSLFCGNVSSLYGGGAGFGDSSLVSIVNCGFYENAGGSRGGGVWYCSYSDSTISNCVFSGNRQYGIEEADRGNITPLNCLFYNNSDGDFLYHDAVGGGFTSYTGGDEINQNVPNAHDNLDGDPRFIMNGAGGISGVWSATPVYNGTVNRTLLIDSSASFVTDELTGRIINVNTSQYFQAYIASNTTTTIEVFGDLTEEAQAGVSHQNYKIIDHHLGYGSPCIDVGTSAAAPATDIDGDPRPVDIAGCGADGTGTEFDVGVYEAQSAPSSAASRWQFY